MEEGFGQGCQKVLATGTRASLLPGPPAGGSNRREMNGDNTSHVVVALIPDFSAYHWCYRYDSLTDHNSRGNNPLERRGLWERHLACAGVGQCRLPCTSRGPCASKRLQEKHRMAKPNFYRIPRQGATGQIRYNHRPNHLISRPRPGATHNEHNQHPRIQCPELELSNSLGRRLRTLPAWMNALPTAFGHFPHVQ